MNRMSLSRQNSLDTRERYRKFKHNSSLLNILRDSSPETNSVKPLKDLKTTKNNFFRNKLNHTDDDTKWTIDDIRADVIKHPDNLTTNGGDFTKRQKTNWKPGENSSIETNNNSKYVDHFKCLCEGAYLRYNFTNQLV